ncbi:MAG: PEP-CTERM sorting domain-containing protein [Betaproteobacteria bacterium]
MAQTLLFYGTPEGSNLKPARGFAMKNPLLRTLIAAAALSLGLASQAAPIIRLTDGSTSMQLGNAADARNVAQSPGDMTYVGTLGNHWMVSLTSSPGSLRYSVNASNIGAGGTYLDLELSDTDFSLDSVPALAQFLGNITGKTQGMVTWWMFADDGNGLFAQTTEIGHGTNGSDTFFSSFDGLSQVDGTYSMTLRVRINHGNSERLTSFDFQGFSQVALVPEPGTIALLAMGLLGLAAVRRRA